MTARTWISSNLPLRLVSWRNRAFTNCSG